MRLAVLLSVLLTLIGVSALNYVLAKPKLEAPAPTLSPANSIIPIDGILIEREMRLGQGGLLIFRDIHLDVTCYVYTYNGVAATIDCVSDALARNPSSQGM